MLEVDIEQADGGRSTEFYTRASSRWMRAERRMQADIEVPRIERKESVDKLPALYASSLSCGCTKQVFDPTPEIGASRLAVKKNGSGLTLWADREEVDSFTLSVIELERGTRS